MKHVIFLAALMLTACGVDGEPVQPSGGVDVTLSEDDMGLGANVGLEKGSARVEGGL